MEHQLTMFDMLYENFKINKPIRLIENFAGIGAQAKALKNLSVEFEHWKTVEWAIPSILAYSEIHHQELAKYGTKFSQDLTKEQIVEYLYAKGISSNYNEPMGLQQIKRLSEDKLRNIYDSIQWNNNLVNIQQVHGKDLEIKDTDKYCYIYTYSFPCQDLSLAGLGKGMSKGSGTRSGMLWEVERILDECNELGTLPQVLLMENVPQVIGCNAINDFQEWRAKLESLGYSNYVEVLNAKDYGIPQNRERCFMVSILGEYNYTFPKPIKLEKKLKDLLEKDVDEKYYLSHKAINYVLQRTPLNKEKPNFANNIIGNDGIRCAGTITTSTTYKGSDNYIIDNMTQEQVDNRIYLKQKLCNSLIENNMVEEGDVIRHSYSNNRLNNGEKNIGKIENQEKISPTLDTRCDCLGAAVKDEPICNSNLRIRKLTGKECYRLMGFSDDDCDNARKVLSESMIYHTAGDSIVVNVLMAIFKEMVK